MPKPPPISEILASLETKEIRRYELELDSATRALTHASAH